MDPQTGTYSTAFPTPTGIAADPPLSSKGYYQARELAEHLISVTPPVDVVVSSPYYRCLETVKPFVELAASPATAAPWQKLYRVRPDTGFAEWYGSAPFEHPTHAAFEKLSSLFPTISLHAGSSKVSPSRYGESLEALHNRVAAATDALIKHADEEGHRTAMVCTHAAVVIAMGRVLTGLMPDDESKEDFRAFTCGLSLFRRKSQYGRKSEANSSIDWLRLGVGGGWLCEQNSDCSFLSEGEERGWYV